MGRGTSQTEFAFKWFKKCFPKPLIQLIFAPGNAVKLIGQVGILLFIPLTSLKSHFGGDRSVHSNLQQSNSLTLPVVTEPLG